MALSRLIVELEWALDICYTKEQEFLQFFRKGPTYPPCTLNRLITL